MRDDVELVLVMSVNPGFGGQRFIAGALDKLRRARAWLPAGVAIEVDGGVSLGNAAELVACGANVLVAGNSVYGAADPAAAFRELAAAVARLQPPRAPPGGCPTAAPLATSAALRYTGRHEERLRGGVKVPTGGESPRTPQTWGRPGGIPGPTVRVRMREDRAVRCVKPWSTVPRGFLYGT